MARVDAAEYTEKWSRRLKASTPDIQKGVNKVTVSPTEKAARQAETALAKIIEAFQNGTWAAQLRKVDLQSWKDSALQKGLTRIAQGVDSAIPGQQEMAQRLLQAVDAAVAKVETTPRGDLETNIGRMVTFTREMAARKLKRPAGAR